MKTLPELLKEGKFPIPAVLNCYWIRDIYPGTYVNIVDCRLAEHWELGLNLEEWPEPAMACIVHDSKDRTYLVTPNVLKLRKGKSKCQPSPSTPTSAA